jgi:hypothetical protein
LPVIEENLDGPPVGDPAKNDQSLSEKVAQVLATDESLEKVPDGDADG